MCNLSAPRTATVRRRRAADRVLALVVALGVVLAACTGSAESSVAANVGTTEITEAMIEQVYDERTEASELARALDGSEGATVDEELRREVLTNLIRREILRVAAEEQQIEVSDDNIAEERAALVERVGGEETLDELLAANAVTEDQFRAELRDQVIQTKLGEQLRDDVTDADVRAAFGENQQASGSGTSFAEAADDIRAELEDAAAGRAVGEYLAGLVDELGVEVDEQYGRWDEVTIAVVSSSRPETPELPPRSEPSTAPTT